jgi:hypothetical protein
MERGAIGFFSVLSPQSFVLRSEMAKFAMVKMSKMSTRTTVAAFARPRLRKRKAVS